MPKINHFKLEELYQKTNRREFVSPDPLQFLYQYDAPEDREIVGLIASSFAYGGVGQILKSVEGILAPMGKSPRAYIESATSTDLDRRFSTFVHRWHRGPDLIGLLKAIRQILGEYSTLEKCFIQGLNPSDETVLPALDKFVTEITARSPEIRNNLLPLPNRGSACKRLHMYLRWMARHDEVDPGGWDRVPASKLIVPIDTHMHRIALHLKLTRRKQADLKTAEEITRAFKSVVPDDPVRFDFSLTRLGIRKDMDWREFVADYRKNSALK